MKSKNPKIQILNEIVAILMLMVVIFSTLFTTLISSATEGNTNSTENVALSNGVGGNLATGGNSVLSNGVGGNLATGGNSVLPNGGDGNSATGENNSVSNEEEDWSGIDDENDSQNSSADIEGLRELLEKNYGLISYEAFSKKILENDLIEIKSEGELIALSLFYAENSNPATKEELKGKTYRLTKSIKLSSDEWNPIGTKDAPFYGTFDGAGYTISNIVITKKQSYAGLFGYISDATIKNLKIGNSKLNMDVNITDKYLNDVRDERSVFYSYLGGVVGYALNSKISNCKNTSDIEGGQYVGGIVGMAKITDKSLNTAIIINDCSNTGTIQGTKGVGGIIGYAQADCKKESTTTTNNKSTTTSTNYEIYRCKNTGLVVGIYGMTGGIAGGIYKNLTINKCMNSGSIEISVEKVKYYRVNGEEVEFNAQNVGGIVGWASGSGEINNATDDVIIRACINDENASVKGYQDVGGIVGQLGGDKGGKAIVDKCISYSNDVNAVIKYSAGMIAGNIGVYQVKKDANGKIETTEEGKTKYNIISVGHINNCHYIISEKETDLFNTNHSTININSNNQKNIVRGYGFASRVNDDDTVNNKIDSESTMYKITKSDNKYLYLNNTKLDLTANGEITNDYRDICYLLNTDGFGNGYEGNETNGWTITDKNKFIDHNGKIYIDKNAPIITDVKLKLSDGTEVKDNRLVKKDDIVTIEITFDEKINIENSSEPVLKVIENTNYKANFVRLDENKLYFSYTVTGSENSTLGNKMYLSGNIKDTFGKRVTGIDANLKEGKIIVLKNDKSDILLTSANGLISYTLKNFVKGFDGNFYYNSNNSNNNRICITAEFTGKAPNNLNNVPSLVIVFEDEKGNKYIGTNTNTTSITSGNDNTSKKYKITYQIDASELKADGINIRRIKSIGLNTNFKITINEIDGPNKIIDDKKLGLMQNEETVQTMVNVSNLYVDTTAPNIEIAANAIYPKASEKYTAQEEIEISLTTSELLDSGSSGHIPNVSVKFGNVIGNFNKGKAEFVEAVENEDDTYTCKYKYVIQPGDEGVLNISCSGKLVDFAGNETRLEEAQEESIDTIYADTTSPTVAITAKKVGETSNISNSITNATNLIYTFTWSEEVIGFTADDITVNNGTKGTLSTVTKNQDGTYSYTMNITPNVENGNEGQIQVIIEQDACQDLVRQSNVRTESIIRVDKKSPDLERIESFVTSTSIKLNTDVDTVKQYYKVGDVVTVVATFSENVATVSTEDTPKLALEFSKSGNAKGTVSNVSFEGNKLKYTYTITNGDNGTLAVKGFTGKVKDSAGNITQVTKRTLDGDTIIADTTAPTFVGITAIAPKFEYNGLLEENTDEAKRYGVQNTITIITQYSENIYNLANNNTTINKITDNTKPVLELKFGDNGGTRTATYEKTEGSKIYYKYNIVSGDNGNLAIVSLNGTVSDIAGNTYTINISSPKLDTYEENIAEENKINIKADTTKPSFNITTNGTNYDDNRNTITGTKNNYREGGVIEITVTTNEYVYKQTKENDKNTLSEFTRDTGNFITLEFGETSAKGTITCNGVSYSSNTTEFKYEYTITDGDNGTLKISIDENKISDIALNKNDQDTKVLSDVVADTINPVTNWQSWVEGEGYGICDEQNGTWEVTFNEKLYVYDSTNHAVVEELTTSNKNSAPILLVSKDNNTSIETEVYAISIEQINGVEKTKITYKYSDYTKNIGVYGMKLASVSDIAGNLWNFKDQIPPRLESIEIKNPEEGTYKAENEITIQAIFDEKLDVNSIAPDLELKFTESGDAKGSVQKGSINENTITYTYTITDEDNGKLGIKAYGGNGLKDLSDNTWTKPDNLPNLSGNQITADTIAPTVSITSSITSNVTRTNSDTVTYTFTWSEEVFEFTKDSIELTNGLKGEFERDENSNGTVYTLKVDKQAEGTQIIRILPNACKDIAGNYNNTKVVYDTVFIDCTKPIIRAKVNGGTYAVDTESKNSTLKETIVVNEELSEFKYIWSTEETMPTTDLRTVENIQVNSDINLSQKISLGENQNNAEYYLYIKVTDLAGNVLEARTNKFMVKKSVITLTVDKTDETDETDETNEDVVVTVNYGEALTENRKAGISGKTQSVDSSKVIVSENGIVYAEASDKAGNKVYNTLEISNIDKTVPEATITYRKNDDHTVTARISFNKQNVTITNNSGKAEYVFGENGEFTFEFIDKAGNTGTALAKVENIDKTAPIIEFYYTLTTTTVGNSIGATIKTDEEAKISYSWDNKNWTESKEYKTNINAVKSPTKEGTYTLYAKATDKSGNTSDVEKLEFTVVKSIENSDISQIVFEGLYTTKVNGLHYVKVSSDMTSESVKTKMNNTALNGVTPEFANLTKENKLKTGSEIKLNGETKYIVIVNGDVNCDGKIDFLGDIITANNYRIGIENLNTMQKLAADIDNDGKVEFISDILSMNNYRIGITKSL